MTSAEQELIPIRKEQIDLENGLIRLPDSKTTSGIADMPISPRAREGFESQTGRKRRVGLFVSEPQKGSASSSDNGEARLGGDVQTGRRPALQAV